MTTLTPIPVITDDISKLTGRQKIRLYTLMQPSTIPGPQQVAAALEQARHTGRPVVPLRWDLIESWLDTHQMPPRNKAIRVLLRSMDPSTRMLPTGNNSADYRALRLMQRRIMANPALVAAPPARRAASLRTAFLRDQLSLTMVALPHPLVPHLVFPGVEWDTRKIVTGQHTAPDLNVPVSESVVGFFDMPDYLDCMITVWGAEDGHGRAIISMPLDQESEELSLDAVDAPLNMVQLLQQRWPSIAGYTCMVGADMDGMPYQHGADGVRMLHMSARIGAGGLYCDLATAASMAG